MPNVFMIFIFSFLAFFLVHARPLSSESRDVVDPPITSPSAGTVWHVGDTETVTWDVSNFPAMLTNPNGTIVLGFLANNSENLMLDSPLAKDFNLRDAKVQIIVPSVPGRTDYIIALMGDSGNISPRFTITGGSSGTNISTSVDTSTQTSTQSPIPIISSPQVTNTGTSPLTTSTTPSISLSSTSATSSLASSSVPASGSSVIPALPAETSSNAAQSARNFDALKVYQVAVAVTSLFIFL